MHEAKKCHWQFFIYEHEGGKCTYNIKTQYTCEFDITDTRSSYMKRQQNTVQHEEDKLSLNLNENKLLK